MATILKNIRIRLCWIWRIPLILLVINITRGHRHHLISPYGDVIASFQLQILLSAYYKSTTPGLHDTAPVANGHFFPPGKCPLLLVLGSSITALRHMQVSPPVPMLVGEASHLQLLTATLTKGPTYGPRAGAASVTLLLVDRPSSGEEVTRLLKELRASALWAARTHLILLLIDGDPSSNITKNPYNSIPTDRPMDIHNTTSVFPKDFLIALPNKTSAWGWNSSLHVLQPLVLPPKQPSPPVRYMGWPCAETLRHPGKTFVRDVGDAALAEEVSRRVPEMRGAICVECEPKGLGVLLPNGSFTGRLADLSHGYIDIMGYSFIRYLQWAPIVELIYPHQEDNLCLETRRSPPISFLHKALRAFSLVEYILLFIIIIALSIVFRLVRTLYPLEKSVLYESTLLEIFRSLLFGQFCKGKIRFTYLLFSLSLSSTILTNAFLGTMTSSLSVVEYKAEVNTLREAIKAANEICVPASLLQELCSSETKIVPELCKKSVNCSNSEDYFKMRKKMLQGKRSAVVSYSSYFKLYSRFPELRIDDEIVIRQVPECILRPSYSSFLVRKDLPYAGKVSFLIQVIVQSGLYEKFSKDSTDIIVLSRSGVIIRESDHSTKNKPLSLKDIDKIFLYLAGMLLLSSVVFIFELFCVNFRYINCMYFVECMS